MSHTYKNYEEQSKAYMKALIAHERTMMDDFREKNLVMLYPDSTFQPVFDGLEKDAPVKELKCPGAPERKKSRTA
jgi:hypothetical protein